MKFGNIWIYTILFAAIEQTAAIQIPFGLGSYFENDNIPHYTTLEEDDLPIQLKQYENDIVVRVKYGNDKDLKKLLLGGTEDFQFSKWGKSNLKQEVDIQITEDNFILMIERFPNLSYDVIVEDLAQSVFESYPKDFNSKLTKKSEGIYKHQATEEVVAATKANALSEVFFKDYRPLETIDAWLDILQQSFPEVLKIEEIGETFEHRKYKVVHLATDNDDTDHHERKTIVVTGGVHAREWISVSSVLYNIYELLNFYTENPDSKILDKLDFLFVPVANPDGYAYTWDTDRLWRKNRQETVNPKCFGIDIDHSYDFHWTKSSDWPCGEGYSGEHPYEATEAKIWEEYLNATNNNHQIYGFIDYHSYSQEVLFPYAYSCDHQPRDEENLIELAYGIAKAIRMESGKSYGILPACIDKDSDLLPDLGSGSVLDFMYHNKAFWAYQLKLRDSGSHGFLLPAKYIGPVGREIFAGFKFFCSFILGED